MNHFPVLRLPHLALRLVIYHLDTEEQIEYCLHLKKWRAVTKSIIAKNAYHVTLNFCDLDVSIMPPTIPSDSAYIDEQFMSEKTHLIDENVKVTDEAELIFDSIKKWTDFVCDSFNSHIHSLYIDPHESIEKLKDISIWVTNRQPLLKEFDVFADKNTPIENNTFKVCLDGFKSECFSVNAIIKEDFKHPSFEFDSKEIHLRHSYWVSLENVMRSSKCSQFNLKKSSLTNENVNEILKKWSIGCLPNLDMFMIETEDEMDEKVVLSGIKHTRSDITYYYDDQFSSKYLKLIGGFNIKNVDGEAAIFVMKITEKDQYDDKNVRESTPRWKTSCFLHKNQPQDITFI